MFCYQFTLITMIFFYSFGHLDFDILCNCLTNSLSDRTFKRQTSNRSKNEARIGFHQVQKTVYKFLSARKQPSQVKVHVPVEYHGQAVIGEYADDLIVDIGKL